MSDDPTVPHPPPRTAPAGRQQVALQRDDRRKAALKANMARRKAQARGRQQAEPQDAPDPITRTE